MKTNNLVYKATKTIKGEAITVKISLNDECKNGHQDFHITGEIYESGKPRTDRYMISCGCVHDDILKAFPQFKQFVSLHGCDYLGNPTYATANGYYHLTEGFNNTPVKSESFPAEFCEYYRIDLKQFEVLSTAKNKIQYAMILMSLGIPAKWKAQADEAIKALEELTGNEFIIDSVRDQFGMPTDKEIEAEKGRIAGGYYSETETNKRHEQAKADFIAKIHEETAKGIHKLEVERDVKIALFEIDGKNLLDSVIYYTHDNSLGFNWRGDKKSMEEPEAKQIFDTINAKYPLSGYKMR